ncbi:hypothetical protein V2A60_003671 [Cordyceps javanica]
MSVRSGKSASHRAAIRKNTPDKDAAGSTYSKLLSPLVSTALHDLNYFDHHDPKISDNELRGRLEKFLQSNQHIKSVRRVVCECRSLDVNNEAVSQIRAWERSAGRSPSIATSRRSIEHPVQTSVPAPVCEKCQEVNLVEGLLSEDIEASPSNPRMPVLVPFLVQHHVCLAVQSAMEAVCFAVVQSHRPKLLRERRWDCPEAASLPAWLDAISSGLDDSALPAHIFGDWRARCALALHEAAVERRRLSYDVLRQGIRAVLGIMQSLPAETLAPAQVYAQNVCLVARQLRDQMRGLESIASECQASLDENLAQIAARRAELDLEESKARQQARDAMAEYEAKWDAEYKATMSAQETF